MHPQLRLQPSYISGAMIATTFAANAVSLVLARGTRRGRALPGCRADDGDGCAVVLNGRWSTVGPVPVARLGAVVYAAAAVASILTTPALPRAYGDVAGPVLALLAPVLVGTAVWFAFLQFAVVRHVCAYCLSVHGLGTLAAALMILWIGAMAGPNAAARAPQPWHMPAAAVGISAVLLLAATQVLVRPRNYAVVASHGQSVLSPGRGREPALVPAAPLLPEAARPSDVHVILHGGKVALAPRRWPRLGSLNASTCYAFFFDHTCDGCRELHGMLCAALSGRRDLAVLCVPVPGEGTCNRHVSCRDPRRRYACAYARLTLAVWLGAPDRFWEFDAFLFGGAAGARLPDLRHATARAESLLGREVFDPTVADGELDPWLREGIELFESLRVGQTPALLLEHGVFVGLPSSAGELLAVFRADASSGHGARRFEPVLG